MTIPAAAFRAAGLEAGDVVKIEALGAGRVVLTKTEALLDRYSGCLETGGRLGERLGELRHEWE